ncbi:MAG TPA: T9SS type A sorting domain-containing protein [Chitinophagaceae bacterium]|jgi:hypothetical protein|nr:T9SS type A sorting domain-containing protein [Chitinophagaceae bacterium]MBP9739915.1 T9SS type A sorting domain-containing protein [Chitinophagaceae bacterium]HPH24518.1 T9SS type A sorting domain-containing protein [Chitinophagaceae bacterium]
MQNFIQKLFKRENFSVFPNPTTKGKVVNLTINNKGNYFVELIDGQSTLLHEENLIIQDKHEVKLFNIPSAIKNGVYYIRVTHAETKKQFTDSILVM